MRYVWYFFAPWILIGFLNALGPGMFSQDRATSVHAVGGHIIENFVETVKLCGVALLAIRVLK
jgi:hypothetical protein